jgi:malate synthase
VATKAEQEQSHADCGLIYARTYELLAKHSYLEACKNSMLCLPHQRASLAYQKRYLQDTPHQAHNIDIVLRYAPLYFQSSMLVTLETWYTSGTKTERGYLPDMPGKLRHARKKLVDAAACWRILKDHEFAFDIKSVNQREAMTAWAASGLIAITSGKHGQRYRMVTNVDRDTSAKCSRCGVVAKLKLKDSLTLRKCDLCNVIADFVLVGQSGSRA